MLPIRFKPFIGPNYSNQEFKIFILGESHYLNESDFSDYLNEEKKVELITNNVLNDFINYKKTGKFFVSWMRTFTKFSNVINGGKTSKGDTIKFWESISFYNYVQAPTRKPRVSPSKAEFNLSSDAFKKVLDDLTPNLIFIWGHRLWDNFPKENYVSSIQGNIKIHFLKFSSRIPILVVPHPSSSKFNYGIQQDINNYLEVIKTSSHKI